MNAARPLSRRTVLRGVGVTMALPWLEVMGQTSATKPPLRMACIFTPNGVNYDAWLAADAAGRFTGTLEAIEPVRRHVNVLTGLTLDKARANGDGPGDHARSSASFLTGRQARKTAGNDLRIGVSVDQFAADQIGSRTRIPSLALGCDAGRRAGNCDSGYSCAYSSNISWRDEDTPAPKLIDPAMAFRRLFGGDDARRATERYHSRRSVLDYVLNETRRLDGALGQADRRKLDEYQTSVRELEQRVRAAQAEQDRAVPDDAQEPEGIPERIGGHIDLMYDMLELAFRTDSTRIATCMVGTGGSNRSYPEIDVRAGHHHLSHHKGDEDMVEQIRKIDRFHVERFARFIQRLATTPEGDGSLLDNCMILHGSGISDGNRHNHEDLPMLYAGGAQGRVRDLGRTVEHPRETPLCGLYLSMLHAMGCDAAEFGDATTPLPLG